MSTVPRDPYEVLGVVPRRERAADQESLPRSRPRTAPRRQRARPRRREQVQGGGRGLRDPLGLRAPGDIRPLRPRRPALRRLRARTSTPSARSATSSTPSSGAARTHAGPAQGGDLAVAVEIDLIEAANGVKRERRLRSDRPLRAVQRQRGGAGNADRDMRALRGRRAAPGRHAHPVRPDGPDRDLRRLPGRGPRAQAALRRVPRPRARRRQARARRRRPRGHRRRAAHQADRARQRW